MDFGILLNDYNTPLKDRGLEEYRKGYDHLHNTKGHMVKLFSEFEKESKFNKTMAYQNLKKYIHWSSNFNIINFSHEDTDSGEAWLSTLKRIAKYNTNRKKDSVLLEIIIRNSMEDFLSNHSKLFRNSWNKIKKAFEQYEIKEYKIDSNLISKSKEDIICLIEVLQKLNFFVQNDFIISKEGIEFKTLPLENN